jgi:hypothetical protein
LYSLIFIYLRNICYVYIDGQYEKEVYIMLRYNYQEKNAPAKRAFSDPLQVVSSETARVLLVVSLDLGINNGSEPTQRRPHLGTVNHLIIWPPIEAQEWEEGVLVSFTSAVMASILLEGEEVCWGLEEGWLWCPRQLPWHLHWCPL